MLGIERRHYPDRSTPGALRAGLTQQQLATLDTMDQLGWVLAFVRRPLFQAPIPIARDRTGRRHAVIETDGTINEDPGFRIRD